MNNNIHNTNISCGKSPKGETSMKKVLKFINEQGEITRRSQHHRHLSTLRIPTMDYILHEISYMSKLFPVLSVMRNFP